MARRVITGTLQSWINLTGTAPINSWAELTRHFSADDVKLFAKLSGDDNPLHIDEVYAASTPFKRCVVHGMLYSSLIGTIFGASVPGAVYVNQSFKFRRPVFVGDAVTARITVTGVKFSPRHLITCRSVVVS